MGLDLSKFKTTKGHSIDDQSARNLIYGPPEAGKTFLASQLIGEGVVLISSERGNLSLADHDVATIEVSNLDDAYTVTKDLISQNTDKAMKHLYLDSISDLLFRDVARRSGNNMKIYGEMFSSFQKFMLLFEHENAPIFWGIAHEEEEKIYTGKEDFRLTGKLQPAMPGSATWNKIKYDFDSVFRLMNIKGERRLQCQDSDKGWAKDRSGKLDKLEPADLMHILKKVRGGK